VRWQAPGVGARLIGFPVLSTLFFLGVLSFLEWVLFFFMFHPAGGGLSSVFPSGPDMPSSIESKVSSLIYLFSLFFEIAFPFHTTQLVCFLPRKRPFFPFLEVISAPPHPRPRTTLASAVYSSLLSLSQTFPPLCSVPPPGAETSGRRPFLFSSLDSRFPRPRLLDVRFLENRSS